VLCAVVILGQNYQAFIGDMDLMAAASAYIGLPSLASIVQYSVTDPRNGRDSTNIEGNTPNPCRPLEPRRRQKERVDSPARSSPCQDIADAKTIEMHIHILGRAISGVGRTHDSHASGQVLASPNLAGTRHRLGQAHEITGAEAPGHDNAQFIVRESH
ncbi:hypothetical protein RCG67_15580, partial [Kocuria sp. CPCC 205292]|uniref:hypothetical protein n=1 Tax=Kocuria cellulosilytica TaxID=3071451 RepID=UPI0034D573F5